jgi:hypothetical protein
MDEYQETREHLMAVAKQLRAHSKDIAKTYPQLAPPQIGPIVITTHRTAASLEGMLAALP